MSPFSYQRNTYLFADRCLKAAFIIRVQSHRSMVTTGRVGGQPCLPDHDQESDACPLGRSLPRLPIWVMDIKHCVVKLLIVISPDVSWGLLLERLHLVNFGSWICNFRNYKSRKKGNIIVTLLSAALTLTNNRFFFIQNLLRSRYGSSLCDERKISFSNFLSKTRSWWALDGLLNWSVILQVVTILNTEAIYKWNH